MNSLEIAAVAANKSESLATEPSDGTQESLLVQWDLCDDEDAERILAHLEDLLFVFDKSHH